MDVEPGQTSTSIASCLQTASSRPSVRPSCGRRCLCGCRPPDPREKNGRSSIRSPRAPLPLKNGACADLFAKLGTRTSPGLAAALPTSLATAEQGQAGCCCRCRQGCRGRCRSGRGALAAAGRRHARRPRPGGQGRRSLARGHMEASSNPRGRCRGPPEFVETAADEKKRDEAAHGSQEALGSSSRNGRDSVGRRLGEGCDASSCPPARASSASAA
jgi:hypothetical protein